MPSTKYYCTTLNNYNDEQEANANNFANDHCSYAIIGREIGSTGTKHLQCYFLLTRARGFEFVRQNLPGHHVEAAKGNTEQNYNYCTKDGDYTEHGQRPRPGSRTDIKRLYTRIAEGANFEELIEETEGAALRYKNAINELIALRNKKVRM